MEHIREIVRNRASNNQLAIQLDKHDAPLLVGRWSLVRKYIGKNDRSRVWYLHQELLGEAARRVAFIDGDIFNYSRSNLKAGTEGIVPAVGFSPINEAWWAFGRKYSGWRFCGLFKSKEEADQTRLEFQSWYKDRFCDKFREKVYS